MKELFGGLNEESIVEDCKLSDYLANENCAQLKGSYRDIDLKNLLCEWKKTASPPLSRPCFEKAGLANDHAAIISRLLVNSDLRGVRTHATRNTDGYCRSFEDGGHNARPDIQILHETPTALALDGNGTLGYLLMVRATEHAISKSKDVGIGMGLMRYVGHYARIRNEASCIGSSVPGYPDEGKATGSGDESQLGYFYPY